MYGAGWWGLDPTLNPDVRLPPPHDPAAVGGTGAGVGDPEVQAAIARADQLASKAGQLAR